MEENIKKSIERASLSLAENYRKQGIFEMGVGVRMPKRAAIVEFINEMKKIMFPGFFGHENTAYVTFENFTGNNLSYIYELLFRQIRTAFSYKSPEMDIKEASDKAEEVTLAFIDKIPYIQEMLMKDVQAEYDGDPAADSKEEVIASYPGMFAIFVYRMAHELYKLKVPFIPRMMSEFAHGNTGIDINPGAEIGEYFFIDHGTGIVIGETTKIGNHVKLYQGVTLGALSTQQGQLLNGVKRHPTIEDNVVIYSNTTVLGGETIIGENSVIAGNTFIIESVPANTKVASTIPELKYRYKEEK